MSGEKRPRCAVCDAPVRLFSLGTEPSETRAFAIVFPTVFTLFVECHGQTWKQAIGHGQPLPAVLFARMNPEEERQAISEASAILCRAAGKAGSVVEITDHWGNTIHLQHVTSEEEAMRIFLTRSPT